MSTLDLPAPYPWPEGKTSAFCFTMDVDAHSPWMWNNRHEVPQLLSHLEQRNFGPRVGIQRIADILKNLGVKGSFYVPGAVAEAHPWMLPALVEAGHEVGLHGYFHELVAQVSDEEFSRVLESSLEIFQKQIGEKPKGFRSPAWEMTPHMLAEVKRHGFYDSSLMGLDTPHTVDGVVEVPVNWGTDDAIFFKFLGGGDPAPRSTAEILGMWTEEFEASHRFGSLFMLTVHDWISGRGARPVMLETLLERVLDKGDVWVATVAEIAAHHAAHAMDRNQITSHIPATLLEHPAWIRT
ncbi:polysaccharide deacetylase family protein [Aquicoccus porphyridii]|uniref:Chitooligosaccharide deacetylase n=1 Tax=Aquicoccus porphyridii TaxID=1852029 RepID=A0A5A9ZTE6_9RHOB|nr:polysaccharide deacetylase family protein [Aquicoccus porphyridii]KAA0920252.1 polysaccharide deacetylase family protein [Aquicoccus porphyridii]RAI54949.1 polysaccharide deacetylase [Rhodobacteraceae bacterium AsT-22]